MPPQHVPPVGPCNKLVAISPNDSADNVPALTRGIIVSVGGDIKATWADGTTTTISAVPAMVLGLAGCARIWATGTTASGLIAMVDV